MVVVVSHDSWVYEMVAVGVDRDARHDRTRTARRMTHDGDVQSASHALRRAMHVAKMPVWRSILAYQSLAGRPYAVPLLLGDHFHR